MHLDTSASAAGQSPQGVNAAECLQKEPLQGNTHCWLLEVQARMASHMHDRMAIHDIRRSLCRPAVSSNLGCIFCFRRTGSLCISSGLPPRALPRLQLRRRANTAQGSSVCSDTITSHSLLTLRARREACCWCGQPRLICRSSMRVGQERKRGLQQNLAEPPGGLLFQRSCCSHTPAVHTLLVKSHLSLLHAGEHSASAACSSPSAACCSKAPSSDRKPSIARPSAVASSCATCPKKHRKHTQHVLCTYVYWLVTVPQREFAITSYALTSKTAEFLI